MSQLAGQVSGLTHKGPVAMGVSPAQVACGAVHSPELHLLRQALQPYRRALVLLLAGQAAQALASLSLPSLSAEIIDQGVLQGDARQVGLVALCMGAAAVLQVLLALACTWLSARIALGVGRDLRSAVFNQVQRFSLRELQQFGTPSLITRSTNDVLQIQTLLLMTLSMVIIAPFMGLGSVVMSIRQDPPLSSLLLVSVPLLAGIVGWLMGRSLPLFARLQGQIDQVNRLLREQIGGLRVIRAFVRDRHESARFEQANAALTDTSLRVGRLMALHMPAVMAVMHGSGVALVWFGAHRIASGQMPVGALVAFQAYIVQIMISVMVASMLFTMAPRALVSAGRIREVLDTPPSVQDPAQPVAAPAGGWAGHWRLDGVGYTYPGAAHPVLQDLTLDIHPGETLAVIGATGAGKTTLLNLFPRLFDVSTGQLSLDGCDVRRLPLATLWGLIGLVPQQSYLFSGTVADNLRYGRAEASEAELWEALRIAQAQDFIAALPQGLASPVAQGGTNFSGGQRQRLTIARALVRQPRLLLLDDSLSALDYATEARLRQALAASPVGRQAAVVLVGQRVSSLRHADRIVVLEQGRIVGQGRHAQLLADCPAYREIVASQQTQESLA